MKAITLSTLEVQAVKVGLNLIPCAYMTLAESKLLAWLHRSVPLNWQV